MRFLKHIVEEEDPKVEIPEEKPEKKEPPKEEPKEEPDKKEEEPDGEEKPEGEDGEPKEPEKTPEELEAEEKLKDLESVVTSVEGATDKNQMNSAVKQAGVMYKQYGEEWLVDLKKALSVNVVPETVERFITYTKNFAEKLTHLK